MNLTISPSVHHSLSSVLCPTCYAHSLIQPVTSEPGHSSRVCPKAPSVLISLQTRLHFNWQLDLAEFRTGHQGSFSTHAGPTPGGVRQGITRGARSKAGSSLSCSSLMQGPSSSHLEEKCELVSKPQMFLLAHGVGKRKQRCGRKGCVGDSEKQLDLEDSPSCRSVKPLPPRRAQGWESPLPTSLRLATRSTMRKQ